MTATPDGKAMINHDATLTRRLRRLEIKPLTYESDGVLVGHSVSQQFVDAGIKDSGLLKENEFIRIFLHTAVGRFGVLMEMAIEAIAECVDNGNDTIEISDFVDAYNLRMDCDEELNLFVAENWKSIDTGTALQRYVEEKRKRRRRAKNAKLKLGFGQNSRPPGQFFVP